MNNSIFISNLILIIINKLFYLIFETLFMFFLKKNQKEESTIESEIEVLTTRLDTSQYMDDKLDALQSLARISRKNPFEVGVASLKSIVNSLNSTKIIQFQRIILIEIFEHKEEFIEIFLNDSYNLEVLLKRLDDCFYDINEIAICILSLKSNLFLNALTNVFNKNNELLHKFMDECINNGNMKVLNGLIRYDIDKRNQVVFYEIFEKVLSLVKETSHIEFLDIYVGLLTDSSSNQNYFYKIGIYKQIIKLVNPNDNLDLFYRIFNAFLDYKNDNFSKFQDIFFEENDVIRLAIDRKQYKFLYLMCHENIDNSKLILEKYLGIDGFILAYHSEKKYKKDVLMLIYDFMEYKDINYDLLYDDQDPYSYYLICSVLFMGISGKKEFVSAKFLNLISDRMAIEIPTLNEGNDIFNCGLFTCLILICDLMKNNQYVPNEAGMFFIEFLHRAGITVLERGLCLLLLLIIKEENIRMNKPTQCFYLKALRKMFYNEDLQLEESICDYLNDRLGDFLIKKEFKNKRKEYENCVIEKVCINEPCITKSPSTYQNKITNFINNVSSKLNNKKDSSDVFEL
ncbi:hypothetical protein TCON_0157 [Astathelohania contejeani]|uniref:Uncharacterized protein n=1 Tax=Astathelohania contejeani TaxID=164912 RepID=A0ABQ7I2G6_9MICR|nr:hypothetical protein TCON_0157 [Thelohania contejeani]